MNLPNAAPETTSSSTGPSGCSTGSDIPFEVELDEPHRPKNPLLVGEGVVIVDMVVDVSIRSRLGWEGLREGAGVCDGVA